MSDFSYSFWSYDLFPYALGNVTSNASMKVEKGVASASCPAMGGRVSVLHQVDADKGEAISRQLNALEAEYKEACEKLRKEYMQKACYIAPFLYSFPAYK